MFSWKSHTLFRPGRRATVVAALLIPVLAACMATGGSRDNPLDGDARRQAEQIEILVRNLHFSQATVYTARGGASRRLGIVPGKGEATFKTSWYLPDIQLRVKFLAGADFLTETVPVGPGELLELIIPSR